MQKILIVGFNYFIMKQHFVIIFGPSAVGKMTVGQELSKITGMKLFHNHMISNFLTPIFKYGTPQFNKLRDSLSYQIFEEFSSSNFKGLIFTFLWFLDRESDKIWIDGACNIFKKRGFLIYFVELYCSQKVRLLRNKTYNRILNKPAKRDIIEADRRLIELDQKYRLNSKGDFYYKENYLRIDNQLASPNEVAKKIKNKFKL